MRLAFSAFRRDHEVEYENDTCQPSSRSVCRTQTQVQPTIVQLYSYPHGVALPTVGLFRSDNVDRARADGVRQGCECNDRTRRPQRRHCKIWQA